jgi:hypothetical protein
LLAFCLFVFLSRVLFYSKGNRRGILDRVLIEQKTVTDIIETVEGI